jgi:AraC-like DNA-binding protein
MRPRSTRKVHVHRHVGARHDHLTDRDLQVRHRTTECVGRKHRSGPSYGEMPIKRRLRRGGLAPQRAPHCPSRWFVRAFKETTGLPPHRWLMSRRIERAQETLINSRLSLVEIAERTGFADQSHFTRVFTGTVGTSPGEWRRERRG